MVCFHQSMVATLLTAMWHLDSKQWVREGAVYELQWYLTIHHDIVISVSSTLVRVGLTQKVLHKIVNKHDEGHNAKLLHYIWHNFSGTGNDFVVINELSKNEHTYACHYGCAPIAQDAILTSPFIQGQVEYSLVTTMPYLTFPHLFLQESSHSSGIPVEFTGIHWNSAGIPLD